MARKTKRTFDESAFMPESRQPEYQLPETPPAEPWEETEEKATDIEVSSMDPAQRAERAWAREATRVDAQDPDLARRTWEQQDSVRGTSRTYHPPRKSGEGKKAKKKSQKKHDQRSFIKSLVIIGICVFLFLFTALMVLSNFVDHPLLVLPKKWATQIITPVQKVFSSVTDEIASYLRKLKVRGEIEYEYEQAMILLDDYADEVALLEEYRRTIDSLYDLLYEQERNYEMNPLAATVIGTDASNYFSTLTLDVGSANGVEPYMAVVSGGGLVGVTYEVEENKCQVRCIISTDCTVAALVQSTRDQGSIKGTLGINGEPMCRLYYLPENAIARPGDVVVTSGVGLEFPKGIPIGKVRESTRGMEENKSYVVVEPNVDFQHLEHVTVYRYKPAYAEAAQSRSSGIAATLEPLSTPRPVPTFNLGNVSDFLFDEEDIQNLTGTEATPSPTPEITPAPTFTPDPNATPLPENLTYQTAMPDGATPSPVPTPSPTPTPTPAPTQDPAGMTVEDE